MNMRAIYLDLPTFAYQSGDIYLLREEILSGADLDRILPFLEMQGIVGALAIAMYIHGFLDGGRVLHEMLNRPMPDKKD